jgi:ubiquinone/menaquinone biosynthesis C-methylase UbiE
MSGAKVNEWDASYLRAENFIFYPHENLVKFVNRHIRKRLGIDRFHDHIRPRNGRVLTALDFGCGIGAGVLFLHEFGIEACGVDISPVCIEVARQYARSKGMDIADRFRVVAPNERLPFQDGQFDFFVACGVLDSMPFADARRNICELARVTSQCGYISLVAGDYRGFYGEEEVQTPHERSTVQSYFNYAKCQDLIAGTDLAIQSCELVSSEMWQVAGSRVGRYHLLLQKAGAC